MQTMQEDLKCIFKKDTYCILVAYSRTS